MKNQIASTAIIHPGVRLGKNVVIEDYCIIGVPFENYKGEETLIGDNATIRSHTVIYAGNKIGSRFKTGNKANIRELNDIGDDVSIGTLSIIEHHVKIENGVRIHSQVFIPEYSVLKNGAWIGPGVVLTNAKYPALPDTKSLLQGPVIEENAKLGAGSVILPGVKIGRDALIGAGSVVTREIGVGRKAVGNPARDIGFAPQIGKKPKVVAIIQARMGSTRLPQKSMMPLADRPLIDHILGRVLQSKLISQVVLAVPDTKEDQILCERAELLGITCFKGSENDLIDRFYQAAKQNHADVVVRICADNPLIHATEIDRIIDYFLKNSVDFASNVSNVMGNSYPDGLGAEVFSFKALEWIHQNIFSSAQREHVHLSFYENPTRFKLGTIACPKEFAFPEIVLDINTQEEFSFISKLFNDLHKESQLIHISDIIPWYKKNRELIPKTYRH